MKRPILKFITILLAVIGANGAGAAECKPESTMKKQLQAFEETNWEGQSELWTDPLGNEASTSDATLAFGSGTIRYTWSYKGESQTGVFTMLDDGVRWKDSWHQPEPVHCGDTGTGRGLFSVEYTYPSPSGPDWAWRIILSKRPDESLVLQMTNITPWGEEGRAVRMTFKRKD